MNSKYDYNVTGGGDDYGSGPYIVTIPAGVTMFPFDIPITDDDILEGNENFMITIDPSMLPDNVTVGDPGQATVTIVDDDSKLCVLTMQDSLMQQIAVLMVFPYMSIDSYSSVYYVTSVD